MKNRILSIAKFAAIIIVVVGSIAYFAYQMYRNMGKGSKASGSGTVRVSYVIFETGAIDPNKVFNVYMNIAADSNHAISAMDLYFNDQQDALDFVPPEVNPPLPFESPTARGFDDVVRTGFTTRPDGTKKLERITMVAKNALNEHNLFPALRIRFKARPTAAFSYPPVVTLSLDTAKSKFIGPAINGNMFAITPANASIAINLGCTGASGCASGQVCYQGTCRNSCSTDGSCLGSYHCDSTLHFCVPNGTGFSSSSSTGMAPTATPYPTASPSKANLYLKVKMPDIATGIAVVPQVRVQVRDGFSPVTELVTTLSRQAGSDYFQTNSPLELDIPAGAAKQYTLFIKGLKTIQRSFTVTLQRGQTKNCIAADATCVGSLKNAELAPLLSGDSDGFQDGSNGSPSSASFNRIDAADLQRLNDAYEVSPLPAEPNADFNLDGKVDIFDLGILGKNYGKQGE